MPRPTPHKWTFRPRFRARAFGWRSQPAIRRVKEAVTEIKKVARRDPVLGAEGAVLFLEKVSPAIEQVDGSSGALGSAVNAAVAELAGVIGTAPADADTREKWLARLWQAYLDDGIPWIESLGGDWGQLCASPEVASAWADRLLAAWAEARRAEAGHRRWFKGTIPALSALLAAGRPQEILDLLEAEPHLIWDARRYGVMALAAQGRPDDAIRFAEEDRGRGDSPVAIARACEGILLAEGRVDEAYQRYGLAAHEAGTYLAWFRAVCRQYPDRPRAQVLADLVAHTPGSEGKWFAAAKSAGLLDEAAALAHRAACAPQTLTRAARDFAEKNPAFAVEAGVAALRWMAEGYGYEVTGGDVLEAWSHTMRAAERAGVARETRARIRGLLEGEGAGRDFVLRSLGPALDRG